MQIKYFFVSSLVFFSGVLLSASNGCCDKNGDKHKTYSCSMEDAHKLEIKSKAHRTASLVGQKAKLSSSATHEIKGGIGAKSEHAGGSGNDKSNSAGSSPGLFGIYLYGDRAHTRPCYLHVKANLDVDKSELTKSTKFSVNKSSAEVAKQLEQAFPELVSSEGNVNFKKDFSVTFTLGDENNQSASKGNGCYFSAGKGEPAHVKGVKVSFNDDKEENGKKMASFTMSLDIEMPHSTLLKLAAGSPSNSSNETASSKK